MNNDINEAYHFYGLIQEIDDLKKRLQETQTKYDEAVRMYKTLMNENTRLKDIIDNFTTMKG